MKTLANLDPNNPEHADFLRFVYSLSFEVDIDSAGRVRIPDALLMWAGIDSDHRDVQINHMGTYLEFAEASRWVSYLKENAPRFRQLAQRIFGAQVPTPAAEVPNGGGA